MGDTLIDGRKTVTTAGTRERLVAQTANQKTCSVCIVGLSTNTGLITVGGDAVVATAATRAGVPLNPGEAVTLGNGAVNRISLADIWIDSTVNGEGVSFLAEVA